MFGSTELEAREIIYCPCYLVLLQFIWNISENLGVVIVHHLNETRDTDTNK